MYLNNVQTCTSVDEKTIRIEMEMDTKIPNAAQFKIRKEDHTLGNLLRMQLLKNDKVIFAGYQMPHPLEHDVLLKIQTTPDTTPLEVLTNEVSQLIHEITSIKTKFDVREKLHQLDLLLLKPYCLERIHFAWNGY